MRATRLVLAGVFALWFTGNTFAQNFQSAITGVKPSEVQFKKIDTGNALGSPSLTSMGQSQFSLTSFFRRLNPFGYRGKVVTPIPQYPSAFQPLPPINSTVNR